MCRSVWRTLFSSAVGLRLRAGQDRPLQRFIRVQRKRNGTWAVPYRGFWGAPEADIFSELLFCAEHGRMEIAYFTRNQKGERAYVL